MKQMYIWNTMTTRGIVIDLRLQYGISVAEAQTSLLRNIPWGGRVRFICIHRRPCTH